MKFTPMYDLESLTEDQRQLYYLSACEYFKVPPELNLLAFFYMGSGEGKRNLVLYAKKGATDIIRGNLQISTISLEQANGPGYVSWVVKGQDKTGRVEQAVGSASIEGLRGQALASQVMIAQTRATRRMTLQFVGGGLLDESELHGALTDINRADSPLATLAAIPAPVQPSVTPNTEAGKDVTSQNAPFIDYTPLTSGSGKEPAVSIASRISNKIIMSTGPNSFTFSNPNGAPAAFSSGDITPASVETVEQPAEPKKRRGRKRGSEIVLDSVSTPPTESVPAKQEATEQAVTVVAVTEPPAQIMNIPTAESARQALQEVAAKQALQQSIPDSNKPFTPEQFEASQVDPDMPTEAEEKAWRARLFVYTNDVLPKGGMRKEDGIIWKIRKYVQLMFPDLPVKNGTVKLNNKQWKHLMGILDGNLQTQGLVGLVKIIEDAAGKG